MALLSWIEKHVDDVVNIFQAMLRANFDIMKIMSLQSFLSKLLHNVQHSYSSNFQNHEHYSYNWHAIGLKSIRRASEKRKQPRNINGVEFLQRRYNYQNRGR